MKYFGTKRSIPTDEDQAALDRLSAIASRYRGELSSYSDPELPLDFPEPEAAPETRQ